MKSLVSDYESIILLELWMNTLILSKEELACYCSKRNKCDEQATNMDHGIFKSRCPRVSFIC